MKNSFPALHLFWVFLGGRPTELPPISINGYFSTCFFFFLKQTERINEWVTLINSKLDWFSPFFLLKTMAKIPCQRAIVSARRMRGEDCRQAKNFKKKLSSSFSLLRSCLLSVHSPIIAQLIPLFGVSLWPIHPSSSSLVQS